MLSAPRFILVASFVAAACAPAAAPASQTAAPSPPAAATATPAVTATPTAVPAGSVVPTIPAPVAVAVEAKATALFIGDIQAPTCGQRPACVASVPKIAALLKKARDAKAPVVYSLTPAAGVTIQPELAAQPGEPTVRQNADKWIDTDLDKILKDKGVSTLVIVGTAAHGVVLYTSFGATLRGYTVVVAEDGISNAPGLEFGVTVARWQLLNQAGFTNAENKPLQARAVTLSTTDRITFR